MFEILFRIPFRMFRDLTFPVQSCILYVAGGGLPLNHSKIHNWDRNKPPITVTLVPLHHILLELLCKKLGLNKSSTISLALLRLAEAEGISTPDKLPKEE
jgi:hypothetical protein